MISKVKLEIFALKLLIYIPFVCISLIVGVLFNRFIESILLICFFSAIRTAFPTTFHILKSDGLCFVFSAVQLVENGEIVDGVFSSQTITTADTELRTFVIDYYIIVDKDCILGRESTLAKTISFTNTGVDATFTSVVVNVDKVV